MNVGMNGQTSRIFLTSDLHFGHDKEFLFKPRGFDTIQEHDQTVISNWNSVVNIEDEVYILGDLIMNDQDYGIECLKQLNGKLHIIIGNHDTDNKIEKYKTLENVLDIQYATVIKYHKYRMYLSHYPTLTDNLENEAALRAHTINFFGHTHSKNKFYNEIPFMYNVALDSHNCSPVLIDQAIEDMKIKSQELRDYIQSDISEQIITKCF